MRWLRPVLKFGAISGISEDEASIHANAYRRWLCALRDEVVDMDELQNTAPIVGPDGIRNLLGATA